MASLSQIYDWFMTGKKPTQAQFWATWDSFRHKDETIPQSAISNLTNTLNAKAEKSQFDSHKSDPNAHPELLAGLKTTGRFLINRNNLMFFADEPITGDTVTGMVEDEYLNAGTFYGGNFEQLSSYVDPDSTEGALFNITSVNPGSNITLRVIAGTDKTIEYYLVHYRQFGDFISATPFSLDQLILEDSNNEIEEYTYFYNAPGEGQIGIENLNEESISNLYVIPN